MVPGTSKCSSRWARGRQCKGQGASDGRFWWEGQTTGFFVHCLGVSFVRDLGRCSSKSQPSVYKTPKKLSALRPAI